uniref:DUF4097 domain-containing protein n=1 Tax=Echinostoma caproni TaxID=27848 RepID=A0A183BCY0_9TREM
LAGSLIGYILPSIAVLSAYGFSRSSKDRRFAFYLLIVGVSLFVIGLVSVSISDPQTIHLPHVTGPVVGPPDIPGYMDPSVPDTVDSRKSNAQSSLHQIQLDMDVEQQQRVLSERKNNKKERLRPFSRSSSGQPVRETAGLVTKRPTKHVSVGHVTRDTSSQINSTVTHQVHAQNKPNVQGVVQPKILDENNLNDQLIPSEPIDRDQLQVGKSKENSLSNEAHRPIQVEVVEPKAPVELNQDARLVPDELSAKAQPDSGKSKDAGQSDAAPQPVQVEVAEPKAPVELNQDARLVPDELSAKAQPDSGKSKDAGQSDAAPRPILVEVAEPKAPVELNQDARLVPDELSAKAQPDSGKSKDAGQSDAAPQPVQVEVAEPNAPVELKRAKINHGQDGSPEHSEGVNALSARQLLEHSIDSHHSFSSQTNIPSRPLVNRKSDPKLPSISDSQNQTAGEYLLISDPGLKQNGQKVLSNNGLASTHADSLPLSRNASIESPLNADAKSRQKLHANSVIKTNRQTNAVNVPLSPQSTKPVLMPVRPKARRLVANPEKSKANIELPLESQEDNGTLTRLDASAVNSSNSQNLPEVTQTASSSNSSTDKSEQFVKQYPDLL